MSVVILHLKQEIERMLEMANKLEATAEGAIQLADTYLPYAKKDKNELEIMNIQRFKMLYEELKLLAQAMERKTNHFVTKFQTAVYTEPEILKYYEEHNIDPTKLY